MSSGSHTARIWNNTTGAVIGGPYTFSTSGSGWKTYTLATGVALTTGTSYTISITTGGDSAKNYAYKENALTVAGGNGRHITYPANAGVYTTTLGTRPAQTYRSANYFRDIVFSPSTTDTQAPTTPTNLTATTISTSQINLAWTASTDNVGVTGYQVFRNNVQIATTTTSYSNTGLTASTTYSYTVKAFDATGNVSGTSNTATATTPGTSPSCTVPGGASASSPTNLGNYLSNTQCTTFVLQAGYYSPVTITRSGITVTSQTPCAAKVQPEVSIRGTGVTVDGLSITGDGTTLTVYNPGVTVSNNCIQGFGKTAYGNGIWVFQEALNPTNHIIIKGNTLDNWGGVQYSGGIAIGQASDNMNIYSDVTVEVSKNRVTNGPTADGLYSGAIQSFHPFIAYGNYINTVNGEGVQNKTFNSHVYCNEMVNVMGDGALYNRANGNNVWEYNLVHDSNIGIDNYTGNNVVYRGNVFYNLSYMGRIKDQLGGSNGLTIENNTFYHSTAWAGFIWDTTSGGTLKNIVWRKNIFYSTPANGSPIAGSTASWDEYENVFWNTNKPTGTTGATSGTASSSIAVDPRFVNPTTDFTVQEPRAQGKGAAWPLPCQ